MAKAGERYEELTGNIWSYAYRGDVTGIKAALVRGVDVNIINTVGWTPCHAAAAGGQTKALRLLVNKAGADLSIIDHGGNLPMHHAAKNGHLKILQVLQDEMDVDITKVRLSQTKGKAVRDFITNAHSNNNNNRRRRNKPSINGSTIVDDKKEGKKSLEDCSDDELKVVGYARKQSKSTAFWGPRRTPISGKIKKKILKDKRKLRKEQREEPGTNGTCISPSNEGTENHIDECEQPAFKSDGHDDLEKKINSYVETVRQIKNIKKNKKRQKQGRRIRKIDSNTNEEDSEENRLRNENSGIIVSLSRTSSSSSESISDDAMNGQEPDFVTTYSRFGVLALSDEESGSD